MQLLVLQNFIFSYESVKSFMFNSLRSKITLVYLGIVLLIAFVGMLSVINIAVIHTSIENIMKVNYTSVQYSQGMTFLLDKQNNAVISYLSTGDENNTDIFFDNIQAFDNLITKERNSIIQPGELDLVDDLHDQYIQFQKSFADLKLIRQTQGNESALQFYSETVTPTYLKMIGDINDISLLNQHGLTVRKEKTSTQSVLALYVLFAATLLAVLTGFFFARHFTKRFLKPLQVLTNNICKVSSGQLNIKLNIKTNDEIGQLSHEFNNMTERLTIYEQSTEGELLKEKNRSLAIVRSISDPLIVLDARYRITLVNQAGERLMGVSEKKAIGRHFLEFVQNGILFDIITECAEKGLERNEKIVKLDAAENERYFNVIAAPVRGTYDGGYVFLMQNVTELKQLERAKNNFIATISHEFKTPLTLVTMGVSMLSSERMGRLSATQQEVISTISEYAENLTSLVNELLELAKIDSGKAIYHFSPCAMADILRVSCHMFHDKAKAENIHFEWSCEENLPRVNADAGKLSYVLNNLLSNAFKYIHTGGLIHVGARQNGNMIAVTVVDNGDGIPPEFIDRIFEQFVQVDDHDIEVRGSGLGLYVAREIIRAHGGEITVDSTPGSGSVFEFKVPVYEENVP